MICLGQVLCGSTRFHRRYGLDRELAEQQAARLFLELHAQGVVFEPFRRNDVLGGAWCLRVIVPPNVSRGHAACLRGIADLYEQELLAILSSDSSDLRAVRQQGGCAP